MLRDPLAVVESYVRECDAGDVRPDSMLHLLVQFYKATEFGLFTIRDVHSREVPLRLNRAQLVVLGAMMRQAHRGKPIRGRILKSRKVGITTEVQTLFAFVCAYQRRQIARTLAHETKATEDIFEIGKLAATKHVRPCITNETEVRWPDVDSKYSCHTAGGVAVGAGGTPSLLHLSEGPKWERNKRSTRYNSVIAVPDVPETIIVEEFTAKGREEFFTSWQDSFSNPDGKYFAVFIPWYFDERCVEAAPSPFARDEEERQLCGRAARQGYELSNEALQWRRSKVADIGAELFRQEFPSTPEEAVQGSKGLILTGLRDCLVRPDEVPFDLGALERACLVGGIDFGYHDPCVIWSGVYVDQVLWLLKCWRQTESLACDQLEGLRRHTTYYCDPAALSDRKNLANAADRATMYCKFGPAPRRKHPGEDFDTTELKALARLVREGRLRIVYSEAAQLLVEADTLAWDEKTGRADRTRTEECGHYDTVDGLKYLAMGVMNRATVKADETVRHQTRWESMAGW